MCMIVYVYKYTMLHTAYIFCVSTSRQVRLSHQIRSAQVRRDASQPRSTQSRRKGRLPTVVNGAKILPAGPLPEMIMTFTVRYWKWPSRKFVSFPVKKWWVSIVMLNYQRAALVHNCGCLQEKQDHFSGKMVRFCPILLEQQEWHIASANLLMSPPTPTGIIMNLE